MSELVKRLTIAGSRLLSTLAACYWIPWDRGRPWRLL